MPAEGYRLEFVQYGLGLTEVIASKSAKFELAISDYGHPDGSDRK